MNSEIWLPIKGYGNTYKVSNLGRVKSLKRAKELIMSQTINRQGYYNVKLSNNNIPKTIETHQLVAQTFLGHVPKGKEIVVDHIDHDKLNNNKDNLQIITFRENCTRGRTGVSKFTGVSWHKGQGKWIAAIRHAGKKLHLGYFSCELKAGAAYQNKLKELTT